MLKLKTVYLKYYIFLCFNKIAIKINYYLRYYSYLKKKKFIRKIIKSNKTRRNIYFSNLFQKSIFPSFIIESENGS